MDHKTIDMPKGILSFETAINRLDIAAALQCRFAGVDSYAFKQKTIRAEQGTLANKFLVFNNLHYTLKILISFTIQVIL